MSDEPNATDAAVKLAEEQGLDLADVLGTGTEGRITKGDVEAHLAALEARPAPDVDPVTNTLTVHDAAPGDFEALQGLALEADYTVQAIAALPNLGAVINWPGDREKYAAQLHARARELLGKA